MQLGRLFDSLNKYSESSPAAAVENAAAEHENNTGLNECYCCYSLANESIYLCLHSGSGTAEILF